MGPPDRRFWSQFTPAPTVEVTNWAKHRGARLLKTQSIKGSSLLLSEVQEQRGEFTLVIHNLESRQSVLKGQLLLRSIGIPDKAVEILGPLFPFNDSNRFANVFTKLPAADVIIYGFPVSLLKILLKDVSYLQSPWSAFLIAAARQKWGSDRKPNFSVLLEDGRRVHFLSNVYGEEARDLFAAIKDLKPARVLALGTAGSLSERLPIGTLVRARSMLPKDTSGAFIFYPKALEARYQRVDTPLVETKSWLDRSLKAGVEFVDVEGEFIQEQLHEFRGHKDILWVISDQMVGEKATDLSHWNDQSLHSMYPIFKQLLQNTLELSPRKSINVDSVEVFYF